MNRFMKNYCLAILALALLLAIAAPVMAAETRGNVAWIEPDDHTFTLVDDDNNVLEMRFFLTGQILIDDQEATFWDIQPGDRITVTYDRVDGELVATRIECRRLN
ncbi:MAG: hypothetical protein HYX68_29490 [Planctomycetes bacterium]|nr:hypothetical protein [Planctomycetota bacterium]